MIAHHRETGDLSQAGHIPFAPALLARLFGNNADRWRRSSASPVTAVRAKSGFISKGVWVDNRLDHPFMALDTRRLSGSVSRIRAAAPVSAVGGGSGAGLVCATQV